VPIAIHGSTPALVAEETSSTTASFTAPEGSLLVALVADAAGSGDMTMSNSGAALTWTEQVRHQLGEDSGAYAAGVAVFTAIPPTSVSRTVTYTSSSSGTLTALKLLVVTGADVEGDPVGAIGEGNSTTANLTPAVYASTVAASRAVGIAADAVADDSATSSDTGFSFGGLFEGMAGVAVYKASNTALEGASVTLNFNGAGETREWNWCAVEILPAVIPFVAGRGTMLGQAVNRASNY